MFVRGIFGFGAVVSVFSVEVSVSLKLLSVFSCCLLVCGLDPLAWRKGWHCSPIFDFDSYFDLPDYIGLFDSQQHLPSYY